MSENKMVVEAYMDAFRAGNHQQVLACLADEVEWEIPGMFHVVGKQAFNRHIEDDSFVGRPDITIARLTEEDGVVVAEGTVLTRRKKGGLMGLRFCDVFVLQDRKIRRLTSYLMEVK